MVVARDQQLQTMILIAANARECRVRLDQHREGRVSGFYISLKQVAPGLKTGYNDAIHARR
jgi:hypothetical protein